MPMITEARGRATRQIATASEGLLVTHGRDESSCVEHANPWNARQPARRFIPLRLRGELIVECRDSLVQRLPRRSRSAGGYASSIAQYFAAEAR